MGINDFIDTTCYACEYKKHHGWGGDDDMDFCFSLSTNLLWKEEERQKLVEEDNKRKLEEKSFL